MDKIHDFYKDFNKLFYWLLILTSWILTADNIGNLFLNKSINEILEKTTVGDFLTVFTCQIIVILTCRIIYEFINIVSVFIPQTQSEDSFRSKQNYKHEELLEEAIKTNNHTMYLYYKDSQSEIKFKRYQKYLCFTVILLFILNICIENSLLRIISENYYNYILPVRIIIMLIIFFNFLGLFLFFIETIDVNNSDIKKKKTEIQI